MTKEQAKEILWNRCQHTPETAEAIRVLSEERLQGEWIFQYRFLDEDLYKCSNCGRLISIYYKGVLSDYKFCPECGAKMKGGNKNG